MPVLPKDFHIVECYRCDKCGWVSYTEAKMDYFTTPNEVHHIDTLSCDTCDGSAYRETKGMLLSHIIEDAVNQEVWCRQNKHLSASEKKRILEENALRVRTEYIL